MATYRVWSGGSNTAPYNSWATAATTFATGLAAATANGDIVLVHYTHQEALAADTTHTFPANIDVISVDKDNADAYTPMGVNGWLGNGTTNRAISLARANGKCRTFGLTLRTAGGTTDLIAPSTGDGAYWEHYDIYVWQGITVASIVALGGVADQQTFARYYNPTIRFANAGSTAQVSGFVEILGGGLSPDGTDISTVFIGNATADISGAKLYCVGFDIEPGATTTATLVGNSTVAPLEVILDRCKLPTSATRLGTQTNLNQSSSSLTILDCHSGNTHNVYEYHNALGALTLNSTIRYTGSPAGVSWQIVTTPACDERSPFVTPWITTYVDPAATVTPRFEILRDGSTAAYTNAQVWGEWTAKTTPGFTLATRYSDRVALPFGAPANQDPGAGLSAWEGESGSAWSGKLEPTSALALAEVGQLSGRVYVAATSATVYVDPAIRT